MSLLRSFQNRPISVVMCFLAITILGGIAYSRLPVSLLPDIPIPEITLRVQADDLSASEVDQYVAAPLREQLMQVNGLVDLLSESKDGGAEIRLKFRHGTNTNLSFIEVNERVDGVMSTLPKSTHRPNIIQASASDIPVFYLNLTLSGVRPFEEQEEHSFLELSGFSETVVKRALEQLPSIAFADITGVLHEEVAVTPDPDKLSLYGVTHEDITRVLKENDINPGSLTVHRGYYIYNVRFAGKIEDVEDVRSIRLVKEGRIFELKDVADIRIRTAPANGLSLLNGKPCITMALIKQPDATVKSLKAETEALLEDLQHQYPEVDFTINRNQTELLDYSITSLQENLLIGLLLVFIVTLIFLGSVRSLLVISLSVVVALVGTFLFGYLFGQSLNIISLAGLVLAVGMMIDSAIVVTELITQYRSDGYSLEDACVYGTEEVVSPLLSSTLTTIAVFLPLIFMSGIAGALFFAQAFMVSVGLLLSYATGILLLPVMYRLLYKMPDRPGWMAGVLARVNVAGNKLLFRLYDLGTSWVFSHKKIVIGGVVLSFILTVVMFVGIPKRQLPDLHYTEALISVTWNESINLQENKRRTNTLTQRALPYTTETASYVGEQLFMLEGKEPKDPFSTMLYLRSESSDALQRAVEQVRNTVREQYPNASISLAPPGNVLDKIFDVEQPQLLVRLQPDPTRGAEVTSTEIQEVVSDVEKATGSQVHPIPFKRQYILSLKSENLSTYGVTSQEVTHAIHTALGGTEVTTIKGYGTFMPVIVKSPQVSLSKLLKQSYISTQTPDGKSLQIPLRVLVDLSESEDLSIINAGLTGRYIPITFDRKVDPEESARRIVKTLSENHDSWGASFAGSHYESESMVHELLMVLLVSLVLMFFILSAQFESFVQPVIVMLEIPIDIGLTLVVMWICGMTLDLMSGIGLIVSTGVIINDSIIKISMINDLRGKMPLMDAIHKGGKRRLRSIIMTSATTILAVIPLLFSFDTGSELQKPLAFAMISTMTIGVLVSLFVVPLVYGLVYRKKGESLTFEPSESDIQP